MNSMPDLPLIELVGLSKQFRARTGWGQPAQVIDAVHDLSFVLHRGGSLAIVGESGSGKTTTARMIVGLETLSAGRILFRGVPLSARPSTHERKVRARQIGIVFQNPYVSLDPRQSARAAVEEVLTFNFGLRGAACHDRAHELLTSVGLGSTEASSRPRQLSGGQCQRVAIARALATQPQLLVLDEAVSSLDVSVQAQILNLLADLRQQTGIALLFVSHNLAVVRQVSDEILVMYRGRAVEYGPVDKVLSSPAHPYTQKLLASVPRPGSVGEPSPAHGEDPESGCRFRGRCPHAFDRCLEEPGLLALSTLHQARCWLVDGVRDTPGPKREGVVQADRVSNALPAS